MNLGLRELQDFLQQHKNDPSMVLATVTDTHGSSYRKPGAMMLIRKNHEYAGLISGGCLEGDLVEHASAVFADGLTRKISYDLSKDDEAIWGLGLGCGGTIHLLLQKLERNEGFGFFPQLFDALGRRLTCVLALARGEHNGVPPGAWALQSCRGKPSGTPGLFDMLEGRLDFWEGPGRYCYAGSRDRVLLVKIKPLPRVLLCGAGPDAVPMARQIDALGWECIVVDHRSAYARTERFPASARVIQLPADQLLEHVNPEELEAAIVMSHNLEHDASYLKQLAGQKLKYLGLLGPKARLKQLQEDLDIPEGTVHGPVGFDIGAELPESIALSVMAEIHAVLNGKWNTGEG